MAIYFFDQLMKIFENKEELNSVKSLIINYIGKMLKN